MTEPTKPDPEADALFEIVRQRYGDRLTPEQLDEVRKIVQAQVEAASHEQDCEKNEERKRDFVCQPPVTTTERSTVAPCWR